jgi:uncharacterized repeat protein (TIGR03809 family)
MSERQPGPYESVARKWHALAERRRMHVIELRESGRWKHYYTAEGLLEALREAVGMRDAWAKLAGLDQQVEAPAVDCEADNEVHIHTAASLELPIDAQTDAQIDAQTGTPVEDEPFRQAG